MNAIVRYPVLLWLAENCVLLIPGWIWPTSIPGVPRASTIAPQPAHACAAANTRSQCQSRILTTGFMDLDPLTIHVLSPSIAEEICSDRFRTTALRKTLAAADGPSK